MRHAPLRVDGGKGSQKITVPSLCDVASALSRSFPNHLWKKICCASAPCLNTEFLRRPNGYNRLISLGGSGIRLSYRYVMIYPFYRRTSERKCLRFECQPLSQVSGLPSAFSSIKRISLLCGSNIPPGCGEITGTKFCTKTSKAKRRDSASELALSRCPLT